ncbi:MAG TPA: glycosyltransferase family 9 protein [Chthoniobacterales bacterium]
MSALLGAVAFPKFYPARLQSHPIPFRFANFYDLFFASPRPGLSMKSVLVVQLKRIGDLILTTPALVALRQAMPEAKITLLIDRYSEEVAPALPMVDEIFTYDSKRSLPIWLKLLFREYDYCLDFTGNDRSALVAFFSKAADRVSFSFVARRRHRAWIYTDLVSSSVRDLHTIDHYLDLSRFVGFSGPAPEPIIKLPEDVVRSVPEILREIGLSTPFFVVHPGTARREKYWPAERWAELIRYLCDRLQLACLFTGGSDRSEIEHIRAIRKELGQTDFVFNLAGQIPFLVTAAMIRQSRFFLGVDTAAAHVASVFGRPELVLFGPTNPFHWHPRHPLGRVLRAGSESSYQPSDPKESGHPMSDLSTRTVIDAMEGFLDRWGEVPAGTGSWRAEL